MSLNAWKKYLEFADEISNDPDNEDIIDKYFPNVKGGKINTKAHNAIKQIFETKTDDKNILEVLPKFYEMYTHYYPSLTTRRQKLSEVRKVIEKNQSANAYRLSKHDKYFNLDYNQRVDLVETYKAKVLEKNDDKLQVDENEIFSKMRELIMSKNKYDRWIALLLSTGARPVGLISKNKFSLIKDKPGWILVENLAKKRDTQEKQWTERPTVLFDPVEVIREWQRLKKDFKGSVIIDHTGKLSADKNSSLNKAVVKHFQWLKDNPNKSSMLRKLYADMAWKSKGDKAYGSRQKFTADILGHSGMLSSFSYTIVNVSDPSELKNKALQSKINELATAMMHMQIKLSKQENKIEEEVKEEVKEQLDEVEPIKLITRNMKKEDKLAILDKLVAQLEADGIKITNRKLRQLSGGGSKLINEYHKAYNLKKKEKI